LQQAYNKLYCGKVGNKDIYNEAIRYIFNKEKSYIINRIYNNFSIYRIIKNFPILKSTGRFKIPNDLADQAKIEAKKLKTDTPHALYVSPTYLRTSPLTLYYKTLLYSELRALQNNEQSLGIITANAIIVDPDKEKIYFQHRSENVVFYPNKITIFGGGYTPYADFYIGENDGDNIKNTIYREVLEESGFICDFDEAPMLLTKELNTKNIQINFLGAKILKKEKPSTEWEGGIIEVDYNELPYFLIKTFKDWTPLGFASILSWLAIGAPGAGDNVRFNGYSAYEFFEILIEKINIINSNHILDPKK
jgi:hypothetical protein